MNTFIRWGKFNLIGALGMFVQLITLTMFNRLFPRHYLIASALAVEAAIVHNFLWHTRYTWRDRGGYISAPQQFLRFQLANGLISLLGNLTLMRFFVQRAHMPVVMANILAILCCSLLNFSLGNQWVFAQTNKIEA